MKVDLKRAFLLILRISVVIRALRSLQPSNQLISCTPGTTSARSKHSLANFHHRNTSTTTSSRVCLALSCTQSDRFLEAPRSDIATWKNRPDSSPDDGFRTSRSHDTAMMTPCPPRPQQLVRLSRQSSHLTWLLLMLSGFWSSRQSFRSCFVMRSSDHWVVV